MSNQLEPVQNAFKGSDLINAASLDVAEIQKGDSANLLCQESCDLFSSGTAACKTAGTQCNFRITANAPPVFLSGIDDGTVLYIINGDDSADEITSRTSCP